MKKFKITTVEVVENDVEYHVRAEDYKSAKERVMNRQKEAYRITPQSSKIIGIVQAEEIT